MIETIEQITLEYRGPESTEQAGYPRLFSPDFERADRVVDGLIAVPVADRNSLRDYLISDQVSEALDSYIEYNQLHPKSFVRKNPDKIERRDNQINIGPSISKLPTTSEPMTNRQILALAKAYYENPANEEKYIEPTDTIQDIVLDSPEELLIPLLRGIQEDFISKCDDGSPQLLVQDMGPRKYFVDNGIVWQLFTTSSIREQVAAECNNIALDFGGTSKFDFSMFMEDYIDANTVKKAVKKTDKNTDKKPPGESFRDKLDREIGKRYQKQRFNLGP